MKTLANIMFVLLITGPALAEPPATQSDAGWQTIEGQTDAYKQMAGPEVVLAGTLRVFDVPMGNGPNGPSAPVMMLETQPGKTSQMRGDVAKLRPFHQKTVEFKAKEFTKGGGVFSAGWIRAAVPPATQPDIAKLITDLSSEDGQVKVAATKAIFALGKDALEPLAKAGAKQVSPFGTISTRRIDIIYSLLDGLKPNPVPARGGYKMDGFGLRVEWGCGCTVDDVKKMGERHGFVIVGTFAPDATPSCYVKLKAGKNLADVLKAILTSEPQVISANLNYFET